MQPCEDRSDGGMCLIDHQTHIHLNADEASVFRRLWSARQHVQRDMRLSQKDLTHADQRETALPELHEQEPMVRGLQAGGETITQRALRLLQAYQSEVPVHPLLEETATFAQG
jgi:hypothetical protein